MTTFYQTKPQRQDQSALGERIFHKLSVAVTNQGTSLKNFPDPSGENTFDEVTGKTTLYPGLYDSIEITGGEVFLNPGIYTGRVVKLRFFELGGDGRIGERWGAFVFQG